MLPYGESRGSEERTRRRLRWEEAASGTGRTLPALQLELHKTLGAGGFLRGLGAEFPPPDMPR